MSASVGQRDRLDEAALAMQPNVHNLALMAPGAACFGEFAQEGGVQTCVEVICVCQRRQWRSIGRQRPCEAASTRGHRRGIKTFVTERAARGDMPQPEMMEMDTVHLHAIRAEWM